MNTIAMCAQEEHAIVIQTPPINGFIRLECSHVEALQEVATVAFIEANDLHHVI